MIIEKRLFDLSFLEQMDDTNFVVEIITLYLHDTQNDLEEMKRALDTADVATVYKTAHKLKSSTGMLQANILFAILENIEIKSKAADQTNQLAKLVQMARYEFDQLKVALHFHLKEIDN